MSRYISKHIIILCQLLVLLQLGSAKAVEVEYLYKVEIPVSGQTVGERRIAFKQAMETVLVRISGDREIVAYPEVESLLRAPARYVQRYVYSNLEGDAPMIPQWDAANAELESEPMEILATQLLKISFDGRAIEKQLNKKSLPVWGKNRPSTLIWLAVREGRREKIIGASEAHELKLVVDTAAKGRGIPLIYPLQDLQDQQHIRVADIRLGFSDAILTASERYGADIVLVGMLTKRAQNKWAADWTIYRQKVSTGWQLEAEAESVIKSGIDGTADLLASRYSLSGLRDVQKTSLIVQVERTNSISDYAGVQKYLESLTAVESAEPVLIKQGRIDYEVIVRGGRVELERAIALRRLLRRIPSALEVNPSPVDANGLPMPITLRYQLAMPHAEQ